MTKPKIFNRCKRRCPCGAECCLRGDVDHTLCICSEESCSCHSKKRYEKPVAHDPFLGIKLHKIERRYRIAA